jgi:hypothetical protein
MIWGKRYPDDTLAQLQFLPTLKAQLVLNRNAALNAIESLQAATPYELEITGVDLCPLYGKPPSQPLTYSVSKISHCSALVPGK